MAPTLTFRSRDNDPWEVAVSAFDIIAPYLRQEGTVSAASIAAQVDSLTPGKRQTSDEEVEGTASFLLEFWEMFIGIAKQLPYNDPSQDRLMALTKELEVLTTPSSEVRGKKHLKMSSLGLTDVYPSSTLQCGKIWIDSGTSSESNGEVGKPVLVAQSIWH